MTKEDDFKARFIEMMRNLNEIGMKDLEAVWLIGNLAAKFIDRSRSSDWAQFRKTRTQRAYSSMLKDFEAQGNSFHSQGKNKNAYAIQVLAISMVAGTQKDPDVVSGTAVLDDMIQYTVDYYRKNMRANPRYQ